MFHDDERQKIYDGSRYRHGGGGALCMMMAPKAKRNDGKRMVSRALKGMGDVIDDVSDALCR